MFRGLYLSSKTLGDKGKVGPEGELRRQAPPCFLAVE